jgi:hypothetical protein
MKRVLGNLTYANVMATVAVFIALGGASYAAIKLPRNSVGAKQLKAGAVTPAKLNQASRSALVGPAGAPGPQGPAGPAGHAGADLTGTKPLAPGETQTGSFSAIAGEPSGTTSRFMALSVSFPRPLASPLDGKHVVFLKTTERSAPHCPGVGQAEPGFFCAYAGVEQKATLSFNFEDPETGFGGTSRFGAVAFAQTTTKEQGDISGSWAVTAP